MSALSAKVEILIARKDLAKAESTMDSIKAAYPKSPAGFYMAGQLYAGQKKYDQAVKEFEQALMLAPNVPDALTGIVSARLAQRKPEEAIVRLEADLKKRPDSAVVHNLLGEVYLTQKNYVEAERALTRARDLQPGWNTPYSGLATLYAAQGNQAAAAGALEQGLKAVPEDPSLLFALAQVQERSGNYAAAMASYDRVLKRDPSNLLATNNLAALLADHKNDAEGMKRARELVTTLEQSPEPALRDTAGWVYYRAGDNAKAVSLLKPVVEKAPKVGVFNYHLGMAYYGQGDKQAAKLHLGKAVSTGQNFMGVEEARKTLSTIQ